MSNIGLWISGVDWLIVLIGVIGILHLSFANYVRTNYNGVGVTKMVVYSVIWGLNHAIFGLLIWVLAQNNVFIWGDLSVTTTSRSTLIFLLFIAPFSTVLTVGSVFAWMNFVIEYKRDVSVYETYGVKALLFIAGFIGVVSTTLETTAQTGVLQTDTIAAYHIHQLSQYMTTVEVISVSIPTIIGVIWLYSTCISNEMLESKTVTGIIASLLLPLIGVYTYKTGVITTPTTVISVLITTTSIGLGLLWVVVVIDKVFDQLPGSATVTKNTIFETSETAIVIVDSNCRISDANTAAEDLFNISAVNMVNEHVNLLLPNEDICSAITNSTRTVFECDNGTVLECKSRSTTNNTGEEIGKTLVFNDITSERTRQQRVTVLNRVLRHNLRNELNAIRGYVNLLGEASVEKEDIIGEVNTLIDDLNTTGTKAQRIEKVLSLPSFTRKKTPLQDIVMQATQNVMLSNQSLTVNIPTNVSTHVNKGVLEILITEALRNAVEHAEATEIQISYEEGAIHITDNGVGIPNEELTAIRNVTETELNHGSGLGLWLIKWGADTFNGTATFTSDNETTVTITLPE
jgi:PAS domain S-box-containing protein